MITFEVLLHALLLQNLILLVNELPGFQIEFNFIKNLKSRTWSEAL